MSKLMNVYLITTLVLACSTGLPNSVPAQDSTPVECTLTASRERVLFGDSLTVSCTVVIPPGISILDPELVSAEAPDTESPTWKRAVQNSDGSTVVDYGFLIHAFVPDTLLVGPVRGEAVSPDGTSSLYESDTITISVDTVLAAADTIPYPLRPPVTISTQGIPGWFITIVILILTFLIALLVYRFWKKHGQKSSIPVELPIDEVGEFMKIAELALHEKGRLKDLYALVSEAIRAFLHRNMPFDARHETTTEIIRELGKTDYDRIITDEIRGILLETDQVMFAKYVPSWDRSSTIVERALVPVKAILDENRRRIEAALDEVNGDIDNASDVTDNIESIPQTSEHGGAS